MKQSTLHFVLPTAFLLFTITGSNAIDLRVSPSVAKVQIIVHLAHSKRWRLPETAPSVGPLYKGKTKKKKRSAIQQKTIAKHRPEDLVAQPVKSDPMMQKPSVSEEHLSMIRSLMVAINQANKTENYSVLRALGSPAMRKAFTDQSLKDYFAQLREIKYDMSSVLVTDPKLVAKDGKIGTSKALKLQGAFPTKPLSIEFDVTYIDVSGVWELDAIGVQARKAPNAITDPE